MSEYYTLVVEIPLTQKAITKLREKYGNKQHICEIAKQILEAEIQ